MGEIDQYELNEKLGRNQSIAIVGVVIAILAIGGLVWREVNFSKQNKASEVQIQTLTDQVRDLRVTVDANRVTGQQLVQSYRDTTIKQIAVVGSVARQAQAIAQETAAAQPDLIATVSNVVEVQQAHTDRLGTLELLPPRVDALATVVAVHETTLTQLPLTTNEQVSRINAELNRLDHRGTAGWVKVAIPAIGAIAITGVSTGWGK